MVGVHGAIIEIRRTSEYVNCLRAIAIYVDGEKVGSVRDGKSFVHEVSVGRHEVFARIDWQRTDAVEILLGEGERVRLLCGSQISGLDVPFAGFRAFMPRSWIYLRPIDALNSVPKI